MDIKRLNTDSQH